MQKYVVFPRCRNLHALAHRTTSYSSTHSAWSGALAQSGVYWVQGTQETPLPCVEFHPPRFVSVAGRYIGLNMILLAFGYPICYSQVNLCIARGRVSKCTCRHRHALDHRSI